jgi:hypothetical protein
MVIESCRRYGIEPYTNLCDVLWRLPSLTNRQIKEIAPKAWPGEEACYQVYFRPSCQLGHLALSPGQASGTFTDNRARIRRSSIAGTGPAI